jgi:hypothetical protein
MQSEYFRYIMVKFIGRHCGMFRLYYSFHPRFSNLLVKPDTELVIEGFPRSANTFAQLAFERVQPRPVRIAHHLHAAAQITLGARFNLPMLVLIREPVGAVASLITRLQAVSPGQALAQYMSFYKCVEANMDKLVLADFRSVTSAYARVIETLNARFHTSFHPYMNTPAMDNAVFDEIDCINRKREGGDIHQLARPSEAKNNLLRAAQVRVETHPMVDRAKAYFSVLSSYCV